MTRVRLLPRLNDLGVSSLLGKDGKSSASVVSGVSGVTDESSPFVSYAPSGGSINRGLVEEISESIRGIAKDCGFPDSKGRAAHTRFDTEVAICLGSQRDLDTGEALRDDVWSFLSLAKLPDVVAWRFPDKTAARFHGGVRNTFQRLWMRGTTLDLGEGHPSRWRLLEALSEDAMVQIFERASIASDARLARAVASVWITTSEHIGRNNMEGVMRRATKYLRIRNEIIDLAFLEDEHLSREIKKIFFKVAMMFAGHDENSNLKVFS